MFLTRSIRCLGAAGIATLLAACASSPQTNLADGDKLVCVRETSVGSIRPSTTCRTVAQIEREREQAQKDMNFVRQHDSQGNN